MIQDPIIWNYPLSTNLKALKTNPNKELFAIVNFGKEVKTLSLIDVPISKGKQKHPVTFFTICHNHNYGAYSHCSVNGKVLYDAIGIETMFDFVKLNYPDYAEWILFHPEWLEPQTVR